MSTLSDPDRFTRVALAASMIGAGVLMIASAIVMPAIKSDEAAQIAVIAQHPARYYLFTILILGSSMLLVPALIGLMRLGAERSPRLANIGGTLSVFGALVAVGDSMSQLVVWQMGARGGDRAQMAALLHRFDNVAGASLVFALGGLAVVIGIALLAIALYRSRTAPAWAAAALPVGTVLNIAGFSAGSTGVLILSGVVLLAGLGWIARAILGRDAQGSFELAPSSL